MKRTLDVMAGRIAALLQTQSPSLYLYGSAVLDDFRLGWSDIDILCLTQTAISPQQAGKLLCLRQALCAEFPEVPHFRCFEGGFLSLGAFLSGDPDRVVYWGSSGQRITDRHIFDSFAMWELLHDGALLHGAEIRAQLTEPSYAALLRDTARHYEAIRSYAAKTRRGIRSCGWLLDIARGLYTVRTGRVIAKTAAGEWALANGLCPDPETMERALLVRKAPRRFDGDEDTLNWSETLGGAIQRFADVLEAELAAVQTEGFVLPNK